MKSFVRTAFSALVVAGLVNFACPPPANCALTAGVVAATCKMPCCPKAKMPVDCPLLKAQPPRDSISVSAPTLVTQWVPLHVVSIEDLQWSVISGQWSATPMALSPPSTLDAPPSLRAPPAV